MTPYKEYERERRERRQCGQIDNQYIQVGSRSRERERIPTFSNRSWATQRMGWLLLFIYLLKNSQTAALLLPQINKYRAPFRYRIRRPSYACHNWLYGMDVHVKKNCFHIEPLILWKNTTYSLYLLFIFKRETVSLAIYLSIYFPPVGIESLLRSCGIYL